MPYIGIFGALSKLSLSPLLLQSPSKEGAKYVNVHLMTPITTFFGEFIDALHFFKDAINW